MKNNMQKLNEMKQALKERRMKKNTKPSPEQMYQMVLGQMDQDRARTNALESHMLNLDRTLQEYVRNVSAELQNLRAENENLKQMLETILEVMDSDENGEDSQDG